MKVQKKTLAKRFLHILIAVIAIGFFTYLPSIFGAVSAAIGQFFWNNEAISITLPKDTFGAAEEVVAILEHADSEVLQLAVKDSDGIEHEVDVKMRQAGENVVLTILPSSNLKPGKYSLVITDDQEHSVEQQFWWGVLVINTNQSIYQPDDTVLFSIGVLDSAGDMVCDADVTLHVTHQETQEVVTLSTADESIRVSDECDVYGLTTLPDYFATMDVAKVGEYRLSLSATTPEGTYSIVDAFQVQQDPEFIVYRETATRIYPVIEYPVVIEVTPKSDFKGQIIEAVPNSFSIKADTDTPTRQVIDAADDRKEIIWNVDWTAGQTYLLQYVYDAPDVSPELYTLGPLRMVNSEEFQVFQELRTWSIASDAVAYDAVTTSSSASFSHTTSGTDRLLVVFLHIFSQTANPTATVTYNGVGMTLQETAENNFSVNRYIVVHAYTLVNPASGSNTVAITYGGTYATTGASAVSYTGVDQSSPVGATTNTTATGNPTITLATNTANSLVVGASSNRGGDVAPFTPGTGVTERFDWATGANVNIDLSQFGGDRSTTSTGNYTINATGTGSDPHSMVALEIKEVAASGITISGNVYNPGTTTAYSECDGSTNNIAVRASSTTYTTSCNASTGAWSVGSVTQPSAGDGLIVWIDGEATDGALAIRYDGSGDSTGHIFYQGVVKVVSDDATAIDTTDMDAYDSGQDADIPYTVTSGNLTVASGHALMVTAGTTFDPGGSVTTNATGGNFHIDDNAVAYLDTATNTIGADVLVDTGATLYINANTNIDGGDITLTGTGTVTTNAGTPTTTLSGAGTIGGGTGTLTFYNLTLDQSGATILASSLTTSNALTIGDGTNTRALNVETNDNAVDVNGNFTIAANGTYTASSTTNLTIAGNYVNDGILAEGTGTIVLDGAGAANLDPGCGTLSSCTGQNFYNLTISKTLTATEVSLVSSNLRTTNNFYILTGTFVQGAQDVRLEGTNPLNVPINGVYSNTSTGNITLGGGISIGGSIIMQGNGPTCGLADSIVISSTDGTQRAWTGSGTFTINDVTVSDMGGTATIIAYSSTNAGNMGSNWTVQVGCDGTPTNDQLMRHGGWFTGGSDQPFTF